MYRLFFLIPLFFLCSCVNPFSKYEWQSTDNGLKIWTDKGAKVKYHWDGDSRGGVIHGTGTLTISGSQKSSEKINAYYGTINEKGLFNNEAYSEKYIGRFKRSRPLFIKKYEGFGVLALKSGDIIISEFEQDFPKINAETYVFKDDVLIQKGIYENNCNNANSDYSGILDTNDNNMENNICFAVLQAIKREKNLSVTIEERIKDINIKKLDFSIFKKLFIAYRDSQPLLCLNFSILKKLFIAIALIYILVVLFLRLLIFIGDSSGDPFRFSLLLPFILFVWLLACFLILAPLAVLIKIISWPLALVILLLLFFEPILLFFIIGLTLMGDDFLK